MRSQTRTRRCPLYSRKFRPRSDVIDRTTRGRRTSYTSFLLLVRVRGARSSSVHTTGREVEQVVCRELLVLVAREISLDANF